MDPIFLNQLGIQPPAATLPLGPANVPTTLSHLNGLPQESKLASYISNRQQPAALNSVLPQSPVSITKSLANLTLDSAARKVTSVGADFMPASSMGLNSCETGLGHSSSSPSFHTFSSSANHLNNAGAYTSAGLSSSTSSSNNPLAPHNFPALTSPSFRGGNLGAAPPPTTLHYSAALNPRCSPTVSPRPVSSPPLQQASPDRLPRPPTPPEQPAVSTFQEHIGGTTYFYTAQEMAAMAASTGGSTNGGTLSTIGGAGSLGGAGGGASSMASVVHSNGGTDGTSQRSTVDNHLPASMLALPSYSVAPPTPAHLHHLRALTNAPHFFVQDDLRRLLLERQTLAMAQLPPDQCPDLPREVDFYHELVPLDNPHVQLKSNMFGYVTSVYKATHCKTGIQYCLYRIHSYRLNNVKVTQIVDMWKKLEHSGLVQLREVFTTKVFGDNSMIFVFDYHPGAETLAARFSSNSPLQPGWEAAMLPPPSLNYTPETAQQALLAAAGAGREMVSEAVLWSFVIQLTGAVRVIHNGGLACRMLDPSKVLLTDNYNRIRINCCGILDILNFDANSANPLSAVPHNQQEDLVLLGKLIIGVAVRASVPGCGLSRDKIQSALDLIQRTYSRDLSMLIMCLLTPLRIKNINDVMPMIGARFYTAVECATQRSDMFESELAKELHNGRLFRLITKLSTIVDRPHVNNDSNWCETGDRYMLKLFRDYLFYQTHEDGRPWLDLGHIVSVLNKLDSGSPDQIVLMSHDGQNVLVTSYGELKTCFLRSFTELIRASSLTPALKLS